MGGASRAGMIVAWALMACTPVEESAEPTPLPPLDSPEELGGSFRDVPMLTTPDLLLVEGTEEDVPVPTHVVIGDLTGDGSPELIFVSAFIYLEPRSRMVMRYEHISHALAEAGDVELPMHGLPMLASDVDGDSITDLVMAGTNEFNPIWLGDGAGGWEAAEIGRAPPKLYRQQAGSVHAFDIDSDGWLDLLTHEGPILREAPRAYSRRDDLLDGYAHSQSYQVSAFALWPGETVLVWLGNAGEGNVSFFRAGSLDAEGFPLFEPAPAVRGNAAIGDSGPTPTASIAWGAPMGIGVGDLDGDRALDVAIPLDPAHAVFAGQDAWPLEDRTWDTGLALQEAASGVPMLGWGTALVDVDRDGRLDIVSAHGDDSDTWFSGSIGAQHPTIHWNGGDFRFADVTEQLGVGIEGNWKALTVGDIDGDADPDLIVGGQGLMPVVLQNEVEAPGRALAIALRGTTSNHLGIGARVEVQTEPGGDWQLHYVGGIGSPQVASRPRAWVGLGPHDAAHRVRITWPSGVVQEVADLEAGRLHTIEEPRTIAIDPVDRWRPADGTSEIVVRVTPRAPDGSPRADAEVTIEATHGPADFTGPASKAADGAVERTLVAPTQPGSTRLEVTIDGEPLRVYPRVWWR